MLLTAPELNHLRPLTDMIEKTLLSTRLLREMLPDGKGRGIARQPHWQVRFRNGTSPSSPACPTRTARASRASTSSTSSWTRPRTTRWPGWIEIVETLNAGLPGAMWRCHGVSKGVRDKFFEKTQGTPAGPCTARWPCTARPGATGRASEQDQGVRRQPQAIDYRRNIYGEHGDAANAVFVLARLMACVDLDEGSTYNQDIYTKIKLEFERFPDRPATTSAWPCCTPGSTCPAATCTATPRRLGTKEVGAPKGYSAYWGGMDVGVTNHPSESSSSASAPAPTSSNC
jgi:hypothetical protein